jgi:hypothetical protein
MQSFGHFRLLLLHLGPKTAALLFLQEKCPFLLNFIVIAENGEKLVRKRCPNLVSSKSEATDNKEINIIP